MGEAEEEGRKLDGLFVTLARKRDELVLEAMEDKEITAVVT